MPQSIRARNSYIASDETDRSLLRFPLFFYTKLMDQPTRNVLAQYICYAIFMSHVFLLKQRSNIKFFLFLFRGREMINFKCCD